MYRKNVRYGITLGACLVVVSFLFGFYTSKADDRAIAACNNSTPCYEKLLDAAVRSGGLSAGYTLLREIYYQVPEFRWKCTLFGRRLSARIFALHPDFSTFTLTPVTATCNYGLYQSHPQHILVATRDTAKAKQFCEQTRIEIGDMVPGAVAECYRGIGRGLPFIEPSGSKDAAVLASFAAKQCGMLTSQTDNYRTCLSGVFIGIQYGELQGTLGVPVDTHDPMGLCLQQTDATIRKVCFSDFKRLSLSHVATSTTYLEALPEIKKAYGRDTDTTDIGMAIFVMAYDRGELGVSTHDSYDLEIKNCNALPSTYAVRCIQGYAIGLLKTGFPDKQHEAVFTFCKRALALTPSLAKTECPHRQVIGYLKGIYTPKRFGAMCDELQRDFGTTCDKLTPPGYGS